MAKKKFQCSLGNLFDGVATDIHNHSKLKQTQTQIFTSKKILLGNRAEAILLVMALARSSLLARISLFFFRRRVFFIPGVTKGGSRLVRVTLSKGK